MNLAEQIMEAAQEVGLSGELLEMFYEEFDLTEWTRVDGRAYPPYYAYSLGRYRANPAAKKKLRRALQTVPRVDPELYDILFNIEGGSLELEGPTWDIVKWVPWPELTGLVPAAGYMTAVVWEPYPIYHFPAARDPMTLGDEDFNHLFRYSTTLREGGGEEIDQEILERNKKREESERRRQASEDLGFAHYYRDAFKEFAEERGI